MHGGDTDTNAAICGALLAIWFRGQENDIYFQIGLITLIALAAKNAILIIEFAVLKREQGFNAYDAAVQASKMRLRPIVMTSLAFTLGVMPLFLATGASSASQRAIGTGVLGGMVAGVTLGLFFIPLFFVVIERLFVQRKAHA